MTQVITLPSLAFGTDGGSSSDGVLIGTMTPTALEKYLLANVALACLCITDDGGLYVNETTISGIEDLGEAQNENLGRDIATMDNAMVFRNHPILWVPKLDADTTNPVYGLDHSTFYPVCLKGDYLRESDAEKSPNNHNTYVVYVDLTYNFICVDRRRNWVIATNTS